MLWIMMRIAMMITALPSSANSEEGIASTYDRGSGTQVACGGPLNEARLLLPTDLCLVARACG